MGGMNPITKLMRFLCGRFGGHRWRDEKYGMASCARCHLGANWVDIQRQKR